MIIAQGVPMATSFSLISISLPTPFAKHEVEALLDCSFKKGIEKAFYHQYRETFLVYTQFNVLTFINWEKEAMHQALMKLGMKDASLLEQRYIFQDYPILIEPDLEVTCKVSNEQIILKEPLSLYLIIIALVISQSVGLEKYEQDLNAHFEKSQQLLDLTQSYSLDILQNSNKRH